MNFTEGDLIVLGIVILVMFLFRKLDQNNKTLEKVRRYAEKATGELDKLVEQKKTQLKDLAVDIDVQERTGREILKRIVANNEELITHEDQIRDKLALVSDLQGRMNQLNEMTELVDQNMKKVADESNYVDTVGGRLKESQVLVAELNRRLESILGEFDHANREQLELIKSSVMEDYQTRLNLISEQLQDTTVGVDTFRSELSDMARIQEEEKSARILDFKERVEELERGYRESLEAAADKGQLLGEEVFTTLQEDIQQKSDRLEENWLEGMNELKDQVATRVETIRSEMDNNKDQFNLYTQDIAEVRESIVQDIERFKEFSNDTDQKLSSISLVVDEKINTFSQSTEEKMGQFNAQVEESLSSRFTQIENQLDQSLSEQEETFSAGFADRHKELDMSLSAKVGELNSRFKDQVDALAERLNGQLGDVDSQLSKDAQNIQARLEENVQTLEGLFQEMEGRITTFSTDSDQKMDHIEERRETFNREQDEYHKQMEGTLNSLHENFTSRMEEVTLLVKQTAETSELESMRAVDQRYTEYEDVIRQRFEKLEAFADDMNQLEESLRKSLSGQEEHFTEEMEGFSQGLAASQEKERERSELRLIEVRQMIGEIEKELNQLKQQAYDNVSEKLQLFEDDFFTDLKKREISMQENFTEWRKNVDLQLEDMGNNALRDREDVERNSMAQITRKMTELQTRVVDQFDRFQDQVRNFQGSITEQIDSGENTLIEYRQTVHEEWEKNREETLAYLNGEVGSFTTTVDGRLGELQKGMDLQLGQMSSNLETERADLNDLIEKTRSEVDLWQNRLGQQIRDEEASVENDLTDYKQAVSETIGDLKDAFIAQKEELVIASNKDRGEVRKDISDLFERISRLNTELNTKSEQTLELFNETSEQYLIDYQQRFREALNDSDEKTKLMRIALVGTKEKMDSYQQMIHNRIDESYRELLTNVEKIEEKQQEFINQTGIFEQAEALRSALEKDILDLQKQIKQVDSNREALLPLQNECERVLKMYDMVSDKMASFLSEKQKIDLLDGKVARIINLSDAIDMKLDQVSDTDDTMQGYMVRLHQVEDLHKEITRRYKDLEKKSSIVDATTQSVDRNFQMLGRIEEGLTGISEDLVPLKSALGDVKRNSDTLLENKEQVDYIINNVTELDSVMNNFDARMKKMEKAREWLASTETRLENISQQAQEKVKLLGNLASRDGKKSAARPTGSPDMNTREMVIQLARQGWSSEEISRYVKLSRGEVELILELSPDSKEE